MCLLVGQGAVVGALLCASNFLHGKYCTALYYMCFAVHMPWCLLSCFVSRVSCLVIGGSEGTVTWGRFPRGCEGTVIPSRLLNKGGGGGGIRKEGKWTSAEAPGNSRSKNPDAVELADEQWQELSMAGTPSSAY